MPVEPRYDLAETNGDLGRRRRWATSRPAIDFGWRQLHSCAVSSAKIMVRERIAPEITASLFANYRSSADAVMELIDNAVDSRLAKSPLTVDITVHPQSLVVTAAGGEGIGVREIERNYLRWGGSPKRGRQLLGQ